MEQFYADKYYNEERRQNVTLLMYGQLSAMFGAASWQILATLGPFLIKKRFFFNSFFSKASCFRNSLNRRRHCRFSRRLQRLGRNWMAKVAQNRRFLVPESCYCGICFCNHVLVSPSTRFDPITGTFLSFGRFSRAFSFHFQSFFGCF